MGEFPPEPVWRTADSSPEECTGRQKEQSFQQWGVKLVTQSFCLQLLSISWSRNALLISCSLPSESKLCETTVLVPRRAFLLYIDSFVTSDVCIQHCRCKVSVLPRVFQERAFWLWRPERYLHCPTKQDFKTYLVDVLHKIHPSYWQSLQLHHFNSRVALVLDILI